MWVARMNRVRQVRATVMIAIACASISLSGCSGGPSESELAHVKQVTAEAQARKDTAKQLKNQAAAAEAAATQAATAKKAAAAKAMAARVAAGRKTAAAKAATARVSAAREAAAVKAPVRRDANGFALGGPPAATSPTNYDSPSNSDCLQFRDELRAWSNYQNEHRPAGSTNDLPSSGEVQYLYIACHLEY